MQEKIEFNTHDKVELLNITAKIAEVVEKSDVKQGICLLFAPHASCAILLNEDESGFKADIKRLLSMWIPETNWKHNDVDDNATAHLGSSLIGQSRIIPIQGGQLQLGTWQEVFLVELDGPRQSRKVIVQIIKDNP
jgi:secondary thiamine-phosphate synthase enzyme